MDRKPIGLGRGSRLGQIIKELDRGLRAAGRLRGLRRRASTRAEPERVAGAGDPVEQIGERLRVRRAADRLLGAGIGDPDREIDADLTGAAARVSERQPDVELAQRVVLGRGQAVDRVVSQLAAGLIAVARIGKPDPALAVEDTLSQLIGEALQSEDPGARGHLLGTETVHRRRELAEEVKILLNDRLESPPSLSRIAADLACSPFHLSKIFRTTVGVTMRQYLGSLRTRAVARHLSEHPADLTRLAIGMGYADHSHLTNAFRREFGVPPSRFRAAAHSK